MRCFSLPIEKSVGELESCSVLGEPITMAIHSGKDGVGILSLSEFRCDAEKCLKLWLLRNRNIEMLTNVHNPKRLQTREGGR